MDPAHENDDEQFELSSREQAEIVREAASLEGVQKLNDALKAGLLKSLIPIKVEGHAGFQPDEESPFEGEIRPYFRHHTENENADSQFVTEVTPLRGGINYLSIEGHRHVSSEVEDERRNEVAAYVHYASDANTGEVMMDRAAFVLVHPTQRQIVLTTNKEGNVVDVMPYATYRLGDQYGAPDDSEDVDPPHVVASQDQVRAQLADNFGINLAIGASPTEFSELHDYTAKLYGMSVGELFSRKIDIVATFNNIMNAKEFDKKAPVVGEKAVPVSPVVFKNAA